MNGRNALIITLVVVLLIGLGISLATASPSGQATPDKDNPTIWRKIEPQALKAVQEQGTATFLVHLRPHANLAQIQSQRMDGSDRLSPERARALQLEQRRTVVAALQATADDTQRDLRAYLDQLQATGHVTTYQSFWIFNGLAITGDREALLTLAARPEVETIRAERVYRIPDVERSTFNVQRSTSVGWNITAIGANRVWREFGITGEGIVIGSLDSGVDWTHPALRNQYRGASGDKVDHNYNWFDATGKFPQAPTDDHGHGTHTTGTAVGSDGGANPIGVAPGAKWIAVKAFDAAGYGTNVDLHAGLQWMLAPTDLAGRNPDPGQAPDVVNNSWGSTVAADAEFWDDVNALRAAGIVPVFAAGNYGDAPGALGSPGSYPHSFSVGATDRLDDIAFFSSRGPSFWDEIKPDVSAPGVAVRSSFPAGRYATWSGTSMAAPHVTGLVALLQAAQPALQACTEQSECVDDLEQFIRYTAVDLGDPGPDNVFGYGRIDAYQAVRWALSAGKLEGLVKDGSTGVPISWATVEGRETRDERRRTKDEGGETSVVRPSSFVGSRWSTGADAAGHYSINVPGGVYDLTARAFGYETATVAGVEVITGFRSIRDVWLKPAPTGSLRGQVVSEASHAPLAASITVQGAPTPYPTDSTGHFSFTLPAGSHALRISATGHRGLTATVTIPAGVTLDQDFHLAGAPSILVVDADAWTGAVALNYFRWPLDALNLPYATRLITDTAFVPTAAELSAYNLVIWTHPWSSPGYVDRRRGDTATVEALAGYVRNGGRLLLVGQDIGYWDSADGMVENRRAPGFYANVLHARYLGDQASDPLHVDGLPGDLCDGRHLVLNDVYALNRGNLLAPDVVAPADGQAAPVFRYGPSILDFGFSILDWASPERRSERGSPALIQNPKSKIQNAVEIAGLRVVDGPGRLIYLPFSLESAGPRPELTRTFERIIAWLSLPSLTMAADPSAVQPSGHLTFTLRIANTAATPAQGLILTNPIPPELTLVPGSLTGGASYDPTTHTVHWTGDIPPRPSRPSIGLSGAGYSRGSLPSHRTSPPNPPILGGTPDLTTDSPQDWGVGGADAGGQEGVVIRYQATLVTPLAGGTLITNTATLAGLQGQALSASAVIRVAGPNLSPSVKTASRAEAKPGDVLTYTVNLLNSTESTARDVRLVDPIPAGTQYLSGTLTGGATYNAATNQVEWQGTVPGLSRGQVYTFTLSTQPGGPAFDWVPITSTGTLIRGLGDDSNAGPFPIGFSFPFFGQAFDTFRVCSNGWLSFTSNATNYKNVALPNPIAPGNLVALFWTDLDLGRGGSVYTWTNNQDTLVVSFVDVMRWKGNDRYTFQVVLRADGTLTLQYLSMQGNLVESTVGIQNADGSQGLTVVHNQPLVHDGLAIRIAPVQALQPPRITYQARIDPALPANTAIQNIARILDAQGLVYTRTATTLVQPADLSGSTKTAVPPIAAPGDVVTYTITLRNSGQAAAPHVQVTDPIPAGVRYVEGSVTGGAAFDAANNRITWNGAVAPGAEISVNFAVRVNPEVGASTMITNTATVDDGAHSPFPLQAVTQVARPDFSRSTKQVDPVRAASGQTLTYTLALLNTGPVTARGVTLVDPLPAGLHYVEGSLSGGATYDPVANAVRWQGDLRPGGRYLWASSDQPGGPAFNWIDLTSTGVRMSGLEDESNAGPFPIGFDFPFYDQTFDTFRVSSNGWLSFSSDATSYRNLPLPSPNAPGNLVAAFWTDLDPRQAGSVSYWTGPESAVRSPKSNEFDSGPGTPDSGLMTVVSFVGVARHNSPDRFTFQVILRADGSLTLQYLTMQGNVAQATVGIQNADGSQGLTVAHNQPLVQDGLAIRIAVPPPTRITFRAAVTPGLSNDTFITNTATLVDSLGQSITRTAATQVNVFDLTTSQFSVSRSVAEPGARLDYRLVLTNTGSIPGRAQASVPVPAHSRYVDSSATGGAIYDASANAIHWQGEIPAGATHQVTFALQMDRLLLDGTVLDAVATIQACTQQGECDGIHPTLTRSAPTTVAAPDLRPSTMSANTTRADAGDVLTYTLDIRNAGQLDTTAVMTDSLPDGVDYVIGSGRAGSGGPVEYDAATREVRWRGLSPARSLVRVGFSVRVIRPGTIANVARIDDGYGRIVEAAVTTSARSHRIYLPLTVKQGAP